MAKDPSPMKSPIVQFLIHILSLLVPVEDHLNEVIRKAAASRMAQDAEASLKAAERSANAVLNAAAAQAEALQAEARQEYADRIRASFQVSPVVTPQAVAALISAAAATSPATPAGQPSPAAA